jgi:hypothetical protein
MMTEVIRPNHLAQITIDEEGNKTNLLFHFIGFKLVHANHLISTIHCIVSLVHLIGRIADRNVPSTLLPFPA